MASPFSIFRRRQKVMIAALGVLTMFAFVFIPIIMQGMGGQTQTDPVAVKTTKFRNLRESELDELMKRRRKVRLVFAELGARAGMDPSRAEAFVEYFIGPATEEAVVDTWLRARCAEELGIVVNDQAINTFIEQWTANRVKSDDILATFHHAAVSAGQFFDMVRDELLSLQLKALSAPSERAVTPGQRWDYFNRVNRMANIEAIPLAVANYVDKVQDPTDDELKKFFEEHKYTPPNPASPEPGFRVPHRVAFEYFKADVAKFAEREKVTDDDVVKRYEKRADYYNQRFKFRLPTPRATIVPKGPDVKAGQQPKPSKEAGKTATPTDAKKPTEPAKTESKIPPKTDAQQPPKTEPPKTEPKKPGEAKDSKGSTSQTAPSPFRFASMLLQDKADQKKPAEASAKPASPSKTEPPKTEPAKQVVPAKKEQPKGNEQPAKAKDQPKAEQKKAQPDKTTDKRPAVVPLLPEDIFEAMPADMKKAIRDEIARERAYTKIVQIFNALRRPMEEYQKTRKEYSREKLRLDHEKKQVPPPPPEPDFQKLAKENGLTAVRTGLLSQWEARDSDVGGWLPAEIVGENLNLLRSGSVLQSSYQSPVTFRPGVAVDGAACYLYWKYKDGKEYIPEFDKVRDQVLKTWKLAPARTLAKKAAETLAAEANKTGKPLHLLFADRPDLLKRLIEPLKFSWMRLREVAFTSAERAELNSVQGIPMAGEEFMQTVFCLEPGKTGVAFNVPETVVYVVQPSRFTPSYDVRWKLFETGDFAKYGEIAAEDRTDMARAWMKELKTSAGLQWAEGRKPDRPRPSQRPQRPDQDLPDDDF
jgi:hypothetical protein